MRLSSLVFEDGAKIPQEYTCDGMNLSPPLYWSDSPPEAQSFALVVEDPDAPGGTFTHWLLYNWPSYQTHLDSQESHARIFLNGAKQGVNSFGKLGYEGPCPPSGTHRYFFKLFALDENLKLPAGADKEELLRAMQGHVLAEAQLIGIYSKAGEKKEDQQKLDRAVDESVEESFPASDPPSSHHAA